MKNASNTRPAAQIGDIVSWTVYCAKSDANVTRVGSVVEILSCPAINGFRLVVANDGGDETKISATSATVL